MGKQPIRILLIEDNPGDARLIREMLSESRETPFELTVTGQLATGAELLESDVFNLILLDLSLPDSIGLDTFYTLRESYGKLPIVVLTGLNDEEVRLRAVSEGAQDYLVKSQVDARRLGHSVYYALGRHGRQQYVQTALDTTLKELAVAQLIQQMLLPKTDPVNKGFDIHGAYVPVTSAGGDYFDYLEMEENKLGIVIGDVTGHGIGPALLMATPRAYLRAFAQSSSHVGDII